MSLFNTKNIAILITCVAFLASCSSTKTTAGEQPTEEVVEASVEAPSSQPASDIPESQPGAAVEKTALPSSQWIAERVKSSQERLSATRAGQTIWKAIEAHGGLEQWYSRGPLKFRFTYTPVDPEKTVRDSVQVIDTWSARARHSMPGNEAAQFGWDGSQAWSTQDEAINVNVRFWSLTPFYFVGVPFVMADEGINLEEAGEIEFEGRTYDLVKATFAQGTGDAPDDFYVVYVDRETGRVGGVRYIVSYPGFFPDGGHSPEKFMAYDGEQRVDGVLFPQTFRTFMWDADKNTTLDLATNSSMTDVAFDATLTDSYFSVPEGASIVDKM